MVAVELVTNICHLIPMKWKLVHNTKEEYFGLFILLDEQFWWTSWNRFCMSTFIWPKIESFLGGFPLPDRKIVELNCRVAFYLRRGHKRRVDRKFREDRLFGGTKMLPSYLQSCLKQFNIILKNEQVVCLTRCYKDDFLSKLHPRLFSNTWVNTWWIQML